MTFLITAGPTREPIDPVRYLGNRSSGQMGASLADAAIRGGHGVSLILGPVTVAMPAAITRIHVETAAQMHGEVMRQFPHHDLLIMAAAVADYRPIHVNQEKISRHGRLTIECEATEDIIAAAGQIKRPDQRTVAFALENPGDLDRAREKLIRKRADMIVFNPTQTMNSPSVEATLLWPDGRTEQLPCRSKADFADILIQRAVSLFA